MHILQVVIIMGILLINVIELYSIIKVILKSKKVGRMTEYIHKVINFIYWKPLETIERMSYSLQVIKYYQV